MFNFRFPTRQAKFNTVTPNEVNTLLNSDDPVVLIDVRTSGEYRQAHIPGARLIPLDALGRRLKEIPTDRPVVMTCRSGSRSHMACEQLTEAGYTNVSNMVGGLIAWQRAKLPVQH